MNEISNSKVLIKVEYNDGTNFSFDVNIHDDAPGPVALTIMLITRGTLMASTASKAIAYDCQGHFICSYQK